MTMKLLDNPDFQVNNELNNMFSEYSKIFVKYFEMNDLEVSCFYESINEPDDEVMFEPSKMVEGIVNYMEEDQKLDIEHEDDVEISSMTQKPYFSLINASKNAYTMDKYVLRK